MGVGGQGCEDVGNMRSLGRVGNSIQVMDHWTRGEGSVEGRTVGKGRDHPQERGASTLYSSLQTCYSSLTQPARNEHIPAELDTWDTKRGNIQHGSMGYPSKAHPPSSPEGRHRYPHLPQVQIEVQRSSVTGQRSHSQEVAALMSV